MATNVGTAAPAVAVAPVASAAAPVVPPKKPWEQKFNEYVDWTFKATDVRDFFPIKTDGLPTEIDGMVKKVAKVFFMALASLVLFPLALASTTFNWAINNVWGKAVAANPAQPQAPPSNVAVVNPVVNAADAAGVQQAPPSNVAVVNPVVNAADAAGVQQAIPSPVENKPVGTVPQ